MDNICLSGGADGADSQWGMTAGLLGHTVVHWSFKGHKSTCPKKEIVVLTQEQLDEADDACFVASKTLRRPFTHCKQYVKNLLRRNWYQIKDSEAVYAVVKMREGKIDGGTAWAVQMYIDRTDIDDTEKKIYVFNQRDNTWYFYAGGLWLPIDADKVPEPSGVWAGIGTRELTDEGKAAVRKLMRYVRPEFVDAM